MANQHISFRKKQYANNAAAAFDSSSNQGFIVFDSSSLGIYIDGKNYGSTMFGYGDVSVSGNVLATDTFLQAIKKIEQKADAASSAGVQSFGTKTGAISIDTAASSNGSVKFTMDGSTLKGSVAFDTSIVKDSSYKHITVTSSSVSDGTNTFNQYSHPASSQSAITTAALKKIATDASGHVTGTADVSTSDLTALLNNTYEAKFTDGSATPVSLNGTTLTMKGVTQTGGAIGDGTSSTTIEFMTAPTSDNKVATAADIAGVTGAMHYKGTVDGTHALPTTNVTQGDVYVVGAAGTYAGQACEVGDMIIAKTTKASSVADTDWNVINGENQVTNYDASVTAGGSLTKIATVDGTDIKIQVAEAANTVHDANYKHITVSVTDGVSDASGVTYKYTHPASTQSAIGTAALKKIATDASGHITGTANVTAADIPNLDASYEPKFNDGSATVGSMSSNTLVIKGVSQSGGAIATGTPDVSVYFASTNSSTNEAMNRSDVSTCASTFANNAKSALSGTADTADSSDNGVAVALTGTVGNHGLTVTVTDGSVASGETKVVTGGTVYDAMSWETYE